MKYEEKQLLVALEILRDTNEDAWLRDDIAMDLEEVDDERALGVLLCVAQNSDDDETTLSSCGESIGAAWVRASTLDLESYRKLSRPAQDGVWIVIESRKPEWLPQLEAASGE